MTQIHMLAAVLMLLPFWTGCGGESGRETYTAADAPRPADQQTRSAEMQEENAITGRAASGIKDTVTLGAGCFWCVEAVFEQLEGVESVQAGYAGGDVQNPTYEAVCSGSTGHAEVARVVFDTGLISLKDILDMFWKSHDPTTLNRQGADVGTQYRSVIFYNDEEQRRVAEASKAAAQEYFNDPIVTEITSLDRFWVAENYHQDYYRNNRNAPYCQVVIAPKLRKLDLED